MVVEPAACPIFLLVLVLVLCCFVFFGAGGSFNKQIYSTFFSHLLLSGDRGQHLKVLKVGRLHLEKLGCKNRQ